MVQPKYSPEEALERVKLMMKYNLSKTLTENKTLVLEQTTDLTIDDIKNGKSVVKYGMKGPIVGKIQELLISAGYNNISKSGDIDNDFGSLTKGQVDKFQSENTNDKGEPLQKDGKVGTETIKALLKKSESKEGNSIFNCVKNYYADYESKLSADLRNKIKYEYFQDYMSITRPILNKGAYLYAVQGKYKENFFTDGKYELIRDGRSYDYKTEKYTPFNDSQESKWFCMGERKYGVDDTKPSPEDKTTTPTQPVSQQTQTTTSDPLSCVKNYFQTKTLFYYKNAKYTQASVYGTGELEVTLNSNLTWKFLTWKDGKKTWKQYTDGDLSNNGVWSCDGDSNFTMRSTLGNFNFDSKNAEEFFKQIQSNTQSTQNQPVDQPTQTQPATQPTQTGPAAGYTDANQQSTLRRRDSILSDILDNQSINKSVCRKNIRDFYTSFQQKNSIVVDPTTIAQAKRVVQACKDQHYGKFGMLGRGGQNIDNMLDILSGRKEGGPLTQGSDSMWRIK